MKKILFATLVAVLLPTSSFSAFKSISSYDQLLDALKSHKTVSVVIDYGKCSFKPGYEKKFNVSSYGFKWDAFTEMEHDVNGKKEMSIGYARHNWYGTDQYYLNRTLMHVYQDNTFDIIDDEVEPPAFKSVHRAWLVCKLSADGSGGVTIKAE